MKFLLTLLLPFLSSSFLLRKLPTVSLSGRKCISNFNDHEANDFNEFSEAPSIFTSGLIASAVVIFAPIQEAVAKGGEYGLLEGRIASLLHPITMLGLFGTSIYSAYLGLQWRQLRDVTEKLKALNVNIPKLSSGVSASFPLAETIEKLKSEVNSLGTLAADSGSSKLADLKKDIDLLSGLSSLDATYSEYVASRKQLVSANARDKHYATGSVLLGVGVGVSLLGAMNTFLRAGKLFPGPHLYAGAAITGLWAAAAALVPAMQKGNEAARLGHIALNSVNVLLFAWQVVTGFDIVVKVWEKTSWP